MKLYFPVTQLNADELCLYSAFWVASGDRVLSRDEVIVLLETVALEIVSDETQRAIQLKNVLAYVDELYMMQTQGNG